MMCNVDDVKRTVAKRIKMARIERDLKQSELAELLETNQQNIARIEKGEMGEALAPGEANRLMRDLFERIELDARQIVALHYHPDIHRWLQPPE